MVLTVGMQEGVFAIVQIHCLAGIGGKRVHVGGEIDGVIANANDQWTLVPGAKQRVRCMRGEHSEGKCALQPFGCCNERLFKVCPLRIVCGDEVDNDFGIGVRTEGVALPPVTRCARRDNSR